jgi:hypothetical protein
MILAAFQSGLTPYLTHLAIVSAAGLFAVVLLVLLFVRRLFRIRTPIVYYLNEHDLTITFTQLDQDEPEVVVSLGAETRTFQLEGFINFWLDLVKVGRKAADAHIDLTGRADAVGKHVTPRVYRLKRRGLTIKFTNVARKMPDIVVALGSEARTLPFEEFIHFWQDMTKFVPKATQSHLAYMEESARQNIERKI